MKIASQATPEGLAGHGLNTTGIVHTSTLYPLLAHHHLCYVKVVCILLPRCQGQQAWQKQS